MSRLTRSAAEQHCTIRLPGICVDYPCVLAHYRLAGTCGAGMKPPDMQGAYACTPCHDAVDRRTNYHDRDFVRLAHAEGVMRTQWEMLRQGLIEIDADARPPKRSFV